MQVIREKPWNLTMMVAVIVAVGGGAFWLAMVTTDNELKKALLTASLTLIFGSILGGLVKLLLDDVDRGRRRREEEVQFILATLSDLKGVYDRVERTRLLLPAHQSARTYGLEMRELIDARTRLLTVERAIRFQQANEHVSIWSDTAKDARGMADYLTNFLSEFSTGYKEISEQQREYEVLRGEYAKRVEKDPLSAGKPPKNKPWEMISSSELIQDLLDENPESRYFSDFVAKLEGATKNLTQRLREILH